MKKILFLLLFIPFVLNGQSKKISELGAATSVTGTELIPIVQGATTKSVTAEILARYKGVGIYNVLDYGADRTGATESTTAIQNALNACDSGVVYIPAGYYLTGTLVIPNDNIIIKGAGKYLTTLQLKDDVDAGTANGHLIYAGGKDNFVLRDIGLDGNGLNQTKVNNRGGTDIAMSIGLCLRDSVAWGYTNNALIENCSFSNFAARGIVWGKGDKCIITNCEFDNNFTAHIEFWGESTNGEISNCTSKNGCFITFYECSGHTMRDVRILYPYNAHFHHTDEFAITLEATGYGPDNINISDVYIEGDTISKAIYIITNGLHNLSIDNVFLKSADPDGYGIVTEKDTNTVITNCKIIGTKYPIITLGSQWATISNNSIVGNADGYSGIYIDANSDNNTILGNYIKMAGGRPIELQAGATNNIVGNNIVTGAWADALILDGGTTSTIFNNYSSTISSKIYDKVANMLNTGTITDATGITVAMLNEFMYYDEAAATDISSNPQIVDGRNGQKITIIGSSDVNTLTLDDGTGLQLAGAAQCVLGSGDAITFIYSSALDLWIEIGRSNN